MDEASQKIFVVRLDSMGNIILATAAIRCFRNTLPKAKIDTAMRCWPCMTIGANHCLKKHFQRMKKAGGITQAITAIERLNP